MADSERVNWSAERVPSQPTDRGEQLVVNRDAGHHREDDQGAE
jgi:hypothetical protein